MITKSWADIERDVNTLAQLINRSGWIPDIILGLHRGGGVPAHMLAHRLPCSRTAGVGLTYKDASGARLPRPVAYAEVALHHDLRNVLALDDMTVTGQLLKYVTEEAYPGHSVRSAALYRMRGGYQPDYLVHDVDGEVGMPWET